MLYLIAGVLMVILFMVFAIFSKLVVLQEFGMEVLTRSPCLGCGARWKETTWAGGVKGLSRQHLPDCHMKEEASGEG